jgi:putative membrane protein
MTHLLYFAVMAAAMVGLSRILPGFSVNGWIPAIFAAIVLAVVNTIVKPILFVITLPLTILTLGLFLIAINAFTLWLTSLIVPGFVITGWGSAFLAAIILAAVGVAWKAITGEERAVATKGGGAAV